MKLFFGIIASFFLFVGLFPYIKDIRNKKIKPQILSYLGWGFIMGFAGLAMISDVFNWGALIVFIGSAACFFIAWYSWYKKVGEIKTTHYDYVFFGIGVLGIILWQLTSNPDIAIICAIIADFSFGILTLAKVYKNPKSETKFSWLMTMFQGIFSLFAISYISFTEVAYPIYLLTYDIIVLLLVFQIFKKPKSKKENT